MADRDNGSSLSVSASFSATLCAIQCAIERNCLFKNNNKNNNFDYRNQCFTFSLFHYFMHRTEMAEGNGEIIEEMATTQKTDGNGEPERTADYPKLVEYGLDKRVIYSLIIY